MAKGDTGTVPIPERTGTQTQALQIKGETEEQRGQGTCQRSYNGSGSKPRILDSSSGTPSISE